MNANEAKHAAHVTNDADADPAVLARVHRFRDRGLAGSFARRGPAGRTGVMLGDDGRYWVATRADAARLVRTGYEYAD